MEPQPGRDASDPLGRRLTMLGQVAALFAAVVGLTYVVRAGVAAAAPSPTTPLTTGSTTTTPGTTSPTPPPPARWPFAPPARLAARFAPILSFDSAERFRPVDRPGFVVRTDLRFVIDRRFGGDSRRTCVASPTVASLPEQGFRCGAETIRCRGDARCYHYLAVDGRTVSDGPAAYLAVQEEILAGGRPTVYWHANVDQRVIQYWLLYVFNNFSNWHVSDWEQVTVRFDPASTDAASVAPLEIGYSSHAGGQLMLWRNLAPGDQRMGTHPVVYVARGSHANYFRRGAHRVPGCPRAFCTDRSDGRGDVLAPGGYGLRQLTRPAFSGDYSTGNFAVGGRPRLNRGIAISDPQTRAVWRSPAQWLNGASPPD